MLLVEMTDCHRHDGYHYAYAQLHLQPSLGDSSPDTEEWSFATDDRCMSCKWVSPRGKFRTFLERIRPLFVITITDFAWILVFFLLCGGPFSRTPRICIRPDDL